MKKSNALTAALNALEAAQDEIAAAFVAHHNGELNRYEMRSLARMYAAIGAQTDRLSRIYSNLSVED